MAFITTPFNYLRSKFKMSDTPIRTVEKRLAIIESLSSVFGFNTYTDNWSLGLASVSTLAILVVSLIVDLRRGAIMIDNRAHERVEDIVESLVFIATQVTSLLRLYKLIWYREDNRLVVRKLVVDFCKWNTDGKSKKIMSETTRTGWVIFWLDGLILAMTTTFFIARSIKNHSLPSPASGFVIPGVDTQETPYFEIHFVLQMWIIVAQIALAFIWNNIFCSLAVLICGHLDVLGEQLDDSQCNGELEYTGQEERGDSEDNEVRRPNRSGGMGEDTVPDSMITQGEVEEDYTERPPRDYTDLIAKHIAIYETVCQLGDLYGAILGLQPIYTGLVIIASTLLYDGSQQSNLFLQISFDHVVELFLYCYFGDLVSEKSAKLGFKLYSSRWYRASKQERKIVLQMMHRSQKPFTLSAGIFGPLTMEMYSKSMRMTYSMWTVFKGRAAKN